MLRELQERLRAHSHQKFLGRCVDSRDGQLYERVVAVVDAIIERAKADGFLDRWYTGHGPHDSAEWDFKPHGSAQRTIHDSGRRDHALYTENCLLSEGPWLYATNGEDADFAVRFMPGRGFDTAESFLEHVATEAGVTVPEGSGEPIA